MPADSKKQTLPPQHQNQQPGKESKMTPLPESVKPHYLASGKLRGKAAIITGGDSGIGKAAAICFAKEGADVAIVYLSEEDDAKETQKLIEAEGVRCLLLSGDIGDETFCHNVVQQTLASFGKLDILVNNAAEQHPKKNLEDITTEQLHKTFQTNFFSVFYLTKAALPHLHKGASIINTASVVAYEGHKELLDYASTKGAIVAFTRSLSSNLAERGIRVNGVAPGPIWTPLIPSTFLADQVATFGSDTPMKRPGQPAEVGPAYVFLASDDATYITGQVIHVNGGSIVNG
ncbi:SDR family oxidoreductase [Brevibacillus choshinensis]|uniref:SDR family oxidoreductase n=1 Tax=Brevibacillus choshinensis TaxID=54911 RepID=A0ABX7FWI2_BRECH|nr:SDR family oxidoreductase [Brevibacillus choshinensis]QRG70253.1 SDR family oxidoreductase [Brevibacillus choshinensis]